MQRGNEQQRNTVRQAIETGDISQLHNVISIVRETGALDVTRESAAAEAQRALNAISVLPGNDHTRALRQLAAQLLERRS